MKTFSHFVIAIVYVECRSPGGTPLKQETLPCDVNDHAAIFARALKRKFSMCPVGSPDSEKENNTPVGSFNMVLSRMS